MSVQKRYVVFAVAPEQVMVAVLVVSTAEPGRTFKDPKTVLVIDIVQLIAAAAGAAMQHAPRADEKTRITSFCILRNVVSGDRATFRTELERGVESVGAGDVQKSSERTLIGTLAARSQLGCFSWA